MHARSERVFAFLEESIGALPVPTSYQEELLLVHLDVRRRKAQVYPGLRSSCRSSCTRRSPAMRGPR